MYMNNGVNTASYRNFYPSAPGATPAQNATGPATGTGSGRPASVSTEDVKSDPVTFASAVGQSGNVVIAGLVLVGLVFGIMVLSQKFGGENNNSIKATFFNVMIIGLAAAVGTPIWKFLAVRFPIPGASSWILAG